MIVNTTKQEVELAIQEKLSECEHWNSTHKVYIIFKILVLRRKQARWNLSAGAWCQYIQLLMDLGWRILEWGQILVSCNWWLIQTEL